MTSSTLQAKKEKQKNITYYKQNESIKSAKRAKICHLVSVLVKAQMGGNWTNLMSSRLDLGSTTHSLVTISKSKLVMNHL